MADAGWTHHTAAAASTSFWAVARRLPAIVGEAMGLAWRASRSDTVAAIGLNLVAGTMTTLGLLATADVLRQLFTSAPTPDRIRGALPALVIAAVAVTAKGGLTISAGWAQARIMPQINFQAELRLFEATTAARLAAFDDAGFSEEMDRARDRGMAQAASIVDNAVNLIVGLVGVVATAAAVCVIQPILLPCLLLAATPSAVTAIRIARREYIAMLARITRRRRMWMLARLMANRQTAVEVRTYQMRDFLLGEYRRIMTVETAAQMRLVRAQTGTRLAAGVLTGVAVAAVYLVLLALLLAGGIPLGAAAMALLALQSASTSLNSAIFAANGLYEDALYYSDYRDFLDRAAQHVPPSGGQPVYGVEQIRLDNVCLYYTGAGTPAVDGVSLTLRRGEVIALVGENGCGKSTLAKLLGGLYEPSSGTISWDGRNVSYLDRPSMSAHVTVISQNWWRFPFTARENIVVGRSDRPAGQGLSMRDAAQAATAHDMITALPYGYDTLLDPEFRHGHDLSGGQWQRLVSARGFYRDTTVLICDEPSSALDAHAEYAIFQQLRARPDRTIVLITHRLANVRHADRIYVMNHGRIVQEGTHDELVAECGPYREMFRLQASGYA